MRHTCSISTGLGGSLGPSTGRPPACRISAIAWTVRGIGRACAPSGTASASGTGCLLLLHGVPSLHAGPQKDSACPSKDARHGHVFPPSPPRRAHLWKYHGSSAASRGVGAAAGRGGADSGSISPSIAAPVASGARVSLIGAPALISGWSGGDRRGDATGSSRGGEGGGCCGAGGGCSGATRMPAAKESCRVSSSSSCTPSLESKSPRAQSVPSSATASTVTHNFAIARTAAAGTLAWLSATRRRDALDTELFEPGGDSDAIGDSRPDRSSLAPALCAASLPRAAPSTPLSVPTDSAASGVMRDGKARYGGLSSAAAPAAAERA